MDKKLKGTILDLCDIICNLELPDSPIEEIQTIEDYVAEIREGLEYL